MRNLINLYSQICGESVESPASLAQQSMLLFKS